MDVAGFVTNRAVIYIQDSVCKPMRDAEAYLIEAGYPIWPRDI